MKLHYYPETDSLYIDLSSKKSVNSREVTEDIVLDFDANNNLVGMDIQHASKVIDFSSIETEDIPVKKVHIDHS